MTTSVARKENIMTTHMGLVSDSGWMGIMEDSDQM